MSERAPDERAAIHDLFQAVELGLDARKFLSSSLGQMVALRAQQEMFAAAQEWVDVDPFDAKAMTALQIRHKVAAAALSWFGQAIEAGIQAEATLVSNENPD